jgi:hypothetical protein
MILTAPAVRPMGTPPSTLATPIPVTCGQAVLVNPMGVSVPTGPMVLKQAEKMVVPFGTVTPAVAVQSSLITP